MLCIRWKPLNPNFAEPEVGRLNLCKDYVIFKFIYTNTLFKQAYIVAYSAYLGDVYLLMLKLFHVCNVDSYLYANECFNLMTSKWLIICIVHGWDKVFYL